MQLCRTLGWRGKGTHFDLLPLVISESGGDPQLFELPEDLVLAVEIADPKNPKLTSLGLRWHALPAVSGMSLNVGGIVFPATAFSGWYSLPEVAVRDLLDQQRYNLLKVGRIPGHGPENRGVGKFWMLGRPLVVVLWENSLLLGDFFPCSCIIKHLLLHHKARGKIEVEENLAQI